MKILYWIIYFILITILLFIVGFVLALLACIIPRFIGLDLLHYDSCNMDNCRNISLRFQIGAELMIAPILYGMLSVTLLARKSLIKAFTKKKLFILAMIWLLLLICSCYTTYMTAFKPIH